MVSISATEFDIIILVATHAIHNGRSHLCASTGWQTAVVILSLSRPWVTWLWHASSALTSARLIGLIQSQPQALAAQRIEIVGAINSGRPADERDETLAPTCRIVHYASYDSSRYGPVPFRPIPLRAHQSRHCATV